MGRRSRKWAPTAPLAAAPRAERPHATARAHRAPMELAGREHFAGFRSHSALLATGAAVYALGLAALRRAFQARTGAIGFRL